MRTDGEKVDVRSLVDEFVMNINLFGNMIRSGIDEGDEAFINDVVLLFFEIFKMRVISHEIFGGRKDVAKPV